MNKTEMKDAEVSELFKANGESEFNGDVRFTNFSQTSFFEDKYFLISDSTGIASRIPFEPFYYEFKKLLGNEYELFSNAGKEQDFCGISFPSAYHLNPYWVSKPYKLVTPCDNVSVGIGTMIPETTLDVRGGMYCQNFAMNVDPLTMGTKIFQMKYLDPNPAYANATILTIENTNRVLLQLNNDGALRTREVFVDSQNPWPDYVFESAYSLRNLADLKKYIAQNRHLPNVPSAAEVDESGVNLGEMNRLLL